MFLVEWAKADDRGLKVSLGFLCKAKSPKGTEQRCGMIHPDFFFEITICYVGWFRKVWWGDEDGLIRRLFAKSSIRGDHGLNQTGGSETCQRQNYFRQWCRYLSLFYFTHPTSNPLAKSDCRVFEICPTQSIFSFFALVQVLIISCLAYCGSIFSALPGFTFDPLHRMALLKHKSD